MRIVHVAGARPNFMKLAPVYEALGRLGTRGHIVHTGQHYDHNMSGSFFHDLGLPEPEEHLEVGSGTHAVQTARVMERLEPILVRQRPDITLVYGDVNSTLAAALVCSKLLIPVAHVEAGLRSFDRTMPEEVNRLVTDQLSDLLFTTSPEAEGNLLREGVAKERIHFVGNPMIDSLKRHAQGAARLDLVERLGLKDVPYGLVTLHRPSNVDRKEALEALVEALLLVSETVPLVWPMHPRTAKILETCDVADAIVREPGTSITRGILALDPLPYLEFLHLMLNARIALTDSGGIQEETSFLGIPCVTLRNNTERPITVELGTNRLAGTDPSAIAPIALEVLENGSSAPKQLPLWDGNASERIASILVRWHASRQER